MPSLSKKEIQEAARKYFPLAGSLAKKQQRKLPPGIDELDELIGAASVGLTECLHKYDPSRGVPLSHWIYQHIEHAMLDYLRSLDPLPQKAREKVKQVEKAEQNLEQRLGRKPTVREIAEHLGLTLEEVHEISGWGNITVGSLEDETRPPAAEPWEPNGAETDVAFLEWWATLTEDEKMAVRMHLEGAILEDIASILGVSRATAGRILERAFHNLDECLS